MVMCEASIYALFLLTPSWKKPRTIRTTQKRHYFITPSLKHSIIPHH